MTKVYGRATVRPVAQPARAIAIVGFGKSRELAHSLPPDIPIWSLSDAPDYDFPRLDLVFEMHPERDLVLEGERYTRLQSEQSYPIMMLERDTAKYPSSYRYPIEAAKEAVFENIQLGDQLAEYFDSSLPYMVALAVMSGYTTVYVYGFELRTDTEYRYQRIGAALLIGWAAGKGVKVILPPESALLPPTLYGYDNFQCVTRNELGELHAQIMAMYEEYETKLQNASTEDAIGLWTKRTSQAAGALHAIKGMVEICNEKKIATNGNSHDDDYSISRQNLEQMLHSFSNQRSDYMGRLNVVHTTITTRRAAGLQEDQELLDQREENFRQMYMRAGAVHVTNHLIEKLDRAQAVLLPFDDPFFMYEGENEQDNDN